MRIFSFCEHFREWVRVQIEVSFIPGLPQIHLLGLPDQSIKESLIKIKSALRFQGFELPRAKQIIVQIRGGDFKKKSSGLDLAIAVAILTKTNHIFSNSIEDLFVFGEISLSGEVYPLGSALLDQALDIRTLLTGEGEVSSNVENHYKIKELRELSKIEISKVSLRAESLKGEANPATALHFEEKKNQDFFDKRKIKIRLSNAEEFKDLKFTSREARLLELVSLGRHSLLLMGPRGLGKTTLAESLNYFSEPPTQAVYQQYKKYFHHHDDFFWRPFVKPHHSISHLALIGGGAQCSPGEITRAHGGILLLDEMLEFSTKCQDALREPMQNKEIRLVRGCKFQIYPTDFQLIATTNLCPCGQWLPGSEVDCHYSGARCQKYREKLSGPVLDRFDVLFFLKRSTNEKKHISLDQIKNNIQESRNFKNSLMTENESIFFDKDRLSSEVNNRLTKELNSLRRLRASIAIAKTLAIINRKTHLGDSEVVEALNFSWQPFLELRI